MPKGIPQNAEFFVKRVETALKKAGFPGGLEAQACRFLISAPDAVAAQVWARLMAYKFGMPKQTMAVQGKVEHVFSTTDRNEAMTIVQKLLQANPEVDVIDVSGTVQ
jgi:ABC-type sugar transport system substrate-binding protein